MKYIFIKQCAWRDDGSAAVRTQGVSHPAAGFPAAAHCRNAVLLQRGMTSHTYERSSERCCNQRQNNA